MANIEPWGVQHPVAFYAGGDTTRDAFRKHIEEIEEIYAKLNSLNMNKLESSTFTSEISTVTQGLTQDLKTHINATKPHPNYRPSFSDISGTLDAGRVDGLTQLIGRMINSNTNGIVDIHIEETDDPTTLPNEDNKAYKGYIKFKNGLLIQCGTTERFTRWNIGDYSNIYFPKAFSSACYAVVPTLGVRDPSGLDPGAPGWPQRAFTLQLQKLDKKYFNWVRYGVTTEYTGWDFDGYLFVSYIAIGK